MGEFAKVRIAASLQLAYGEELLICGSAATLGGWELKHAPLMTWSDGNRGEGHGQWTAEVLMPRGVRVEFKLVVRGQADAARWLGAGPKQQANVDLETTLGRVGAQPSRIVSEQLPCAMTVEDIAPGPDEGSIQAGQGHENSTVALAGPSRITQAGHTPAGPAAAIAPEAAAAAMLAAHAGAAGHAVTYTTTTTTTTSVVINDASAAVPQSLGPALMGPAAAAPARPAGTPAPGPPQECPPTEAEMQALVAARQLNADIFRAGPVPISWTQLGAKEVLVRGSWDQWQQSIALEPAQGGIFRAMMVLPPGTYEFKFIVDGKWTTSDEMEKTTCSNKNNVAHAAEMVLVPVPLGKRVQAPKPDGNQLALGDSS